MKVENNFKNMLFYISKFDSAGDSCVSQELKQSLGIYQTKILQQMIPETVCLSACQDPVLPQMIPLGK